jgi:AbrB family looped-hinge helix DNA binding protein
MVGATTTLMADIVKIGRHGDVIIPRKVRAALGIEEGDELLLSIENESIVLTRKARRFGAYLEALEKRNR